MPKNPQGRLELTWMGKDLALIPFKDGTYNYAWVEPSDPRVTEVRSIDPTGTVGATEAVLGDDGTMLAAGADDNLLIIGDSGDALRSLGTIPEYADRFRGQVKLVYIDPPFNTQKIFDDYSDQMEHSVWLTFMRDRIRAIKPLLAPAASIWVHLDHAENHRMRALLDEEFGPENFFADIAWQKRESPNMGDTGVSMTHDSIVAYRTGPSWVPNQFEVAPDPKDFPKTDEQGDRYSSRELRKWGSNSLREDRPTMWYPITAPDGRVVYPIRPDGKEGCWRWEAESVARNYERLEWLEMPAPVGLTPYVKTYMRDGKLPRPSKSIWTSYEAGNNPTGKTEVKDLVPDVKPFATPKPERLLERVLHIGSNPGDIVLDCFAGSGTTAAVAQKMGRRWVTVELLEPTVDTFIVPRLSKVIDGTDLGGISTRTERIAGDEAELPEGMTPDQAKAFNSALTKAANDVSLDVDVAAEAAKLARAAMRNGNSNLTEEQLSTLAKLLGKFSKNADTTVDVSKQALAPLRAATKTRDKKTVRWTGGGGFTIARLGPSMYEVEDGPDGRTEVFLSPAATNGAWAAAIAGQLGYRSTPDHPVFAGCKGRERLAVVDGVADELVIRDLHAHLAAGETVLVVAKAALDDVGPLLRDLAPGSTVRVAPGGLLQKGSALR